MLLTSKCSHGPPVTPHKHIQVEGKKTPSENSFSLRNQTEDVAADLAGHHVEPLDVGDGLLRVDDRRILVLHRGRLLLLHGPDDPPLPALEALPVGVHHPLRVRHAAQQRPLERRPGGVVRERVLEKKSPQKIKTNQPDSHPDHTRARARTKKNSKREFPFKRRRMARSAHSSLC